MERCRIDIGFEDEEGRTIAELELLPDERGGQLVISCDHLDVVRRLLQFQDNLGCVFLEGTLRYDEADKREVRLSLVSLIGLQLSLINSGDRFLSQSQNTSAILHILEILRVIIFGQVLHEFLEDLRCTFGENLVGGCRALADFAQDRHPLQTGLEHELLYRSELEARARGHSLPISSQFELHSREGLLLDRVADQNPISER